ncbi:ECF transporter S component [Anaerovorax odorimutans]|uniref:ECF transporter S component n=1 Tax=Anaerovorax odorimutans TaxID=109327 RepID=UPI0003FD31C4|nr:ECF transporter S component [Anaerovorax odorimutans]
MQNNILKICETGIFTAMVFIATFALKLPIPFTEGYTHLGDCMIFISVLLLGWKRGALAGGIGAALADLIGGFGTWVLPTLICKSVMAAIMGIIIEKKLIKKYPRVLWIIAAVIGGFLQCIGYTITRIILYGTGVAIASIPILILQTGIGIFLAFVILEALQKTMLKKYFTYTTVIKKEELCQTE